MSGQGKERDCPKVARAFRRAGIVFPDIPFARPTECVEARETARGRAVLHRGRLITPARGDTPFGYSSAVEMAWIKLAASVASSNCLRTRLLASTRASVPTMRRYSVTC